MPAPTHRPLDEFPAARLPLWRYAVFFAVVAAVALGVFGTGLHREVSLESLVRHRATIDAFVAANESRALIVYMAIYVAAMALSIPSAAVLSIVGGILFGTLVGGLAAAASAVAGATIIFLAARSTIGDWLTRRAGPQGTSMLSGFRADAFHYLLFLRLVPLFPFWLVNLVAAIGGMDLRTFVVATLIGILPATFAFAFFGAGLDSILAAQEAKYTACMAASSPECRLDFDMSSAATPQLIGALIVLGLVALAPVVVKRMRARRYPTTD